MKTKEEILKEATKRTLNINEGSPLHDAVLKAMEEYAQEQVKLFCQPVVVGQSEQLVCPNCQGLEVYIDEYGGKPCKCTKQAN